MRYDGKNMIEPQKSVDNIIWRMRFAFWINKATNTRSEYVIFMVFHDKNGYANATQCSVYMHVACLLSNTIIAKFKETTRHFFCFFFFFNWRAPFRIKRQLPDTESSLSVKRCTCQDTTKRASDSKLDLC
jgi:hypothetical protein